MSVLTGSEVPLLRGLGARVRALREGRDLSRGALARTAGLSVRFLADLERGAGNISIARLAQLAAALEMETSRLIAEAEQASAAASPRLVALLGLRGAGKSSIGPALAERLAMRFVELDDLVSQTAGMPLAQLFELHGEGYYRRLEREVLGTVLADAAPAVVATGGGIVTEPGTFELLRRRATTVWLRARPQDHWDRVVAQGDARPMADRVHAMEELKDLLEERAPLYSRADLTVDTSQAGLESSVQEIVTALTTSP